ncbi:amino acid adenylation domain-containing protein [Streptomyces sp. NBC_01537]|uniref:amino acid adenylation domain-containing protein n=1 Tax=Streptomyces sp. NBC_01537 TaxID=2903896 RepID=UPI00386FBD52
MSRLEDLFAEAVRAGPGRPAITAFDETVSYRELDERAEAVRAELLDRDARPGDAVVVRLPPSIRQVATLIAVLRAGCVHVPLEPRLPERRARLMTDTVHGRFLVAPDGLSGPFGAGAADEHGPGALAYVTFTSGSTGVPKAVGTPHATAVHYLRTLIEAGHVAADDRILQLATPSFDASVRDTLGPLAAGAHLVIGSEDPGLQRDLLRRHAVSGILGIVPTLLRLLADGGGPPFPALRRVLVSGEPLTGADVRRVREAFHPGVTVVNLYGPTECTMTTTAHVIGPADDPCDGPVPIGRPRAGTTIRLLDERLQPVPDGAAGEIYIGGLGVTRGYLADPVRTAERFVADPAAPGKRMYRTGDLARLLPDGDLEFLGRIDRQVKIHGLRVEPGEIEAALRAHPAVREAAVLVADATLHAHVGHGSHAAPDARELRDHLRSLLPEPLVPASFSVVTELPRTASGKLDRQRLRGPERRRPAGAAPRAGSEEPAMLAIWRDLLGEPELGTGDEFFVFGGDSLTALRLLTRVRERWGRALSTADLFEHPTVAGFTAVLAAAEPLPPRLPAAAPDPRTLSFAQERLWFFEQLLPGSPLNTIPMGFRTDGELDRQALEGALRELMAAHRELRGGFLSEHGRPARHHRDDEAVTVRVLPSDDPVASMNELASHPLDLENGPLLDLTVFERAGRAAGLLLRAHHLVSDAWSVELIFKDLSRAYAARRPGPAPPAPVEYSGHVARQRAWLTADQVERHLRFWRAELRDAPQTIDLPTDRQRPAVREYRGGMSVRRVPADVLVSAETFARAEGTTLFTVLLSAWAALLHRYSGQDDLVIGVPMSGRTDVAYESVTGLFVNTLPIRLRLDDSLEFADLVARVRTALARALDHQDFPFERLVEELRPPRDLSHGPLFQVLADYQVAPVPDLPGLSLTPVDVHTGMARFDLSVTFSRRGDAVDAVHTYDAALFDASTVERMTGHLFRLLGSAVRDGRQPLMLLDLLSPQEREELTRGPRSPEVAPPLVVPAFLRWAREAPERVAIVGEGRRVTYGELAGAAGAVAGLLERRGARPETPVAVIADPGPDLVGALLGVLAAGAAYVPLDPAYPPARIAAAARDAGATIALVQERYAGLVPAGIETCVIPRGAGPLHAAEPGRERLAYVIHTSGSTGRPKSVEATHGGLANVLGGMAEIIGFSADDVLLAVTTVSFDIAALELFLPLMRGGRVVTASREQSRDPVALRALAAESGATVMQATPATWRAFAEAAGPAPALRVALCGGEALPPDLLPGLFSVADEVRNVYGPTETTIWSTAALLARTGPVFLGDPIAHTRVLVLDAALTPVPPGVAGELYLGGAGVARGYRGRADLTAERFVPDPFAAEPGARMYRTGDRARRDPTGALFFLGRSDRQVKINGFRIEPGEVEAVLAGHTSVIRAIAAPARSPDGTARLVAYLVTRDGLRLSVEEVRAHVAATLPAYMVPSVVVPLESVPLTLNGKVDLAALPDPGTARPALGTSYTPPAPGPQKRLAGIWSRVLGVERIGVHDDFFALGGNSLLAFQVIARVNEAFGTGLPLQPLFADPTVAGLARHVEEDVILRMLDEPTP